VSITSQGAIVLPGDPTTALHAVPKQYVDQLAADLSGKQPLDSDLTAFAGLTPADDDLPQRKGGVWTSRTPVQVKADMALTKDDVGLDQVSNLAPDALPVSTAQAAYATSRAVALAIVLGG